MNEEIKTKIEWSEVTRRMDELRPYEFNPRNITEKGKADLKKSISRFGCAEPIVINLDNTIIGGHARYFVLSESGEEYCKCYLPNVELNPKQVKELNIRLNKNIAGEFDFNILSQHFEIEDLSDWGFTASELDFSLWEIPIDNKDLDDIPEIPKEAVSRIGDIFLIDGKHRVMCGDSENSSHVRELMQDKRADMIFTDPPYNVDYEGKTKEKLKIANDKKGNEDFRSFLLCVFTNMAEFTKPGGAIYMSHADSEGLNFRGAFMESGFLLKQCIIWNKNSLVMGRQDYHWKHEPILYGWREGAAHSYYGNRSQTTVWDVSKPAKSEEHPTMKPVELISIAICNSSKIGDCVMDLFLGSGSTLISADQQKRICYGMELDPIYTDVILKRYNKLFPGKSIVCLNREFNFNKLFE